MPRPDIGHHLATLVPRRPPAKEGSSGQQRLVEALGRAHQVEEEGLDGEVLRHLPAHPGLGRPRQVGVEREDAGHGVAHHGHVRAGHPDTSWLPKGMWPTMARTRCRSAGEPARRAAAVAAGSEASTRSRREHPNWWKALRRLEPPVLGMWMRTVGCQGRRSGHRSSYRSRGRGPAVSRRAFNGRAAPRPGGAGRGRPRGTWWWRPAPADAVAWDRPRGWAGRCGGGGLARPGCGGRAP